MTEKFTNQISAFTGIANIKIGQVFKVHNDYTTKLLMRVNPKDFLDITDFEEEDIEWLTSTKEVFCYCNLLTGEVVGFYLGKKTSVNDILRDGVITVYDKCDFIPSREV